MDADRAVEALARASGALVRDHDIAGFLADLLASAQDVLRSDAGGMLAARTGRALQVLAASTHGSAELELHQSHTLDGPCVDARDGDTVVTAAGDEELRERWPRFAEVMIAAGFHSVHSSPLRWPQGTLGAMALYRRSTEGYSPRETLVAQSFADAAALLLVRSDPLDRAQADLHVEAALFSRIVIEQAKGVIAQIHDVPLDEAYAILTREARDGGAALTDVAIRTIEDASSAGGVGPSTAP